MSNTRFAKLKGFDNVIAGRDLDNIFKDGHVYDIIEITGMHIIRDLGCHALKPKFECSAIPQIMMDGSHLLTEKEYKIQQENLSK